MVRRSMLREVVKSGGGSRRGPRRAPRSRRHRSCRLFRRRVPLIDQISLLQQFLKRHDRNPATGNPSTSLKAGRQAADRPVSLEIAARSARARDAVWLVLEGLAASLRRHDPGASGTIHELRPALRRWLGASTFATRTGEPGIQLVDPQAARFGEFDDVQLMGLVQGEWPEAQPRNLFYPASLLALLEPARPERVDLHQERDRLRASRAAFHDLLRSAGRAHARLDVCARSRLRRRAIGACRRAERRPA